MSAYMGIGLANMGNAFMKSYADTQERDRRIKAEDEDRAWRNEERDAVRGERTKKAKLDRDLMDASAPRVTMTGTVSDAGQGQVFSATPENAAAMQETLAAEAEMRGQTVQQQPGYAVTGAMSKGHQVGVGAAPAQGDAEGARNQRVLEAYRSNGQFDKAAQMEESVIGLKAKQMALTMEEYKFLDAKSNQDMKARLMGDANWWDGAVKFVSQSQFSPIKDVTAEAVVSKDGSTVEMFSVTKDGKKTSTGVYPANAQGMDMFMEKYQSVPLTTRLALNRDERDRAAKQEEDERKAKMAAEKAALDERRVGVLERNADNNSRKTDGMLMRLATGGGSGGGGGGGAVGEPPSFNPLDGFDVKFHQSAATNSVDDELANLGKPFTPKQRADMIDSRFAATQEAWAGRNASANQARVFLAAARAAKTPQEIEAVRVRALQSGYTLAEMAALDPRFAPPAASANPANPGKKEPAPKPDNAPALTQRISAQPFDRSNPLSVMQANNARAQQEADAREAARVASAPTAEQRMAALLAEQNKRDAWLAGR